MLIAIPSYIDPECWNEFTLMRKAKGKSKPYTPYAQKLVLYEIQRLRERGFDPNECLKQSIKYGWSDVFPPKEKSQERVNQGQDVKKTQDYLANRPEWTQEQSEQARQKLAQIKTTLRRVA